MPKEGAMLSPKGMTVFLGVLTAAYLEQIRSEEDLETLIASLRTYWSIAQERLPGQVELTAENARTVQVLLDALIAHLRGSFALSADSP